MGRALSTCAVVGLLVGCVGASGASRREQIEHFIVSVDACMPEWLLPKPTLSGASILATSLAFAAGDRRGILSGFDCVVAAGGDCERVRNCYGLDASATSGPCNGAPARCDDDILVQCIPANGSSPTQLGRLDCTVAQHACLESGVGGLRRIGCGVALCGVSADLTCEGEALVSCDGAFTMRVDPPPNQTCRAITFNSAAFLADGEPCDVSGCVGGHAVDCNPSAHVVVGDVDCGSIGRVCREFGTTASCEPPPGAECTDNAPSCAGDIVRFCGSDQMFHDYDCRAHGFASCEERTSPIHGTLAGCAPAGPRF